ncbi:hypothetical protein N7510_009799 [Penicillium lagena]|uniref:uncharacterized protein n=1 Tax=Penicillium lagena TaxID=94218 RepID=UPI002541F7CF|nr:uncharacterized protein N7510_009799 [Penicillium lagena]KAJ5604645.1 hypothetical protein N7510_009799 [Penicillium lagena]
MREPRASKRRKVSEEPSSDEDGDIKMEDDDQDFSAPSSPDAAEDDEDSDFAPAPKRTPRRRSTRGGNGLVEDDLDLDIGDATPGRAGGGARSTGRQRKTPKRLEDGVTTPSRRAAATPRSARGARSAQRLRKSPEVDEDDVDVDFQPAAKGSLARTRSRRSTARGGINGDGNRSPSPNEFNDGLDDLVAMQLQHDLQQDQPDAMEPVDVVEPVPEYAAKFQALCQNGLHDEVRTLTSVILDKLSGKRQVPVHGLENEYQKVHQLVEQTVTAGEGNSMLLLGSRGCGKTTIVETTLSSLRKQHGNDFHVVRLNGFLHTDDRLALREMWRQLGRETDTEDDVAKVSSYADTMATLLALLSHPEDIFGPSGEGGAVTAAKSVVIILDEFDLFVTHPRQTLLYNLFDIAQARKAPVAVLGLTTKVDVTEMLEKRVKSRFSHRYVYIPLPRSFETFSDVCLAGLDLDDSECEHIAQSRGWETLLEGWKAYLKDLWEDNNFQMHLKRIFYQTKSVKEFFTSALLPISALHHSTYADEYEIPTPQAFASEPLSCPDPAPLPFSTSITTKSSPSSLPLALVLAATRLSAIFDPGREGAQSLALSFPAAYAEYVRLLTTAKTSASVSGAAATPGRVWGRDVAREAWEKLVRWGLVTPTGSGNGTADGQMFRVEISFEEVVEMAGKGGALGQWWRDG